MVIIVEPLLYTLTHTDGEKDDNNYETAEASVFFAATIPFVFVLVLGMSGIAQLNDKIENVPAIMEQRQRWGEMGVGLAVYSFTIGKVHVWAVCGTLVAVIVVNLFVSML